MDGFKCTDVKDTKGRLIYHNDILEYKGDEYLCFYNTEGAMFLLKDKKGDNWTFDEYTDEDGFKMEKQI